MLEERLNGRLYILNEHKPVRYKEISKKPVRTPQTPIKRFKPNTAYKPLPDHPWNNSYKTMPPQTLKTGHFNFG